MFELQVEDEPKMYRLLALIVFLISFIPARLIEIIIFQMASFAARFPNKELKKILRNVEKVRGLRGGSFARQFARQVFFNQAQAVLETIMEIYRPGLIQIENFNAFKEFLTQFKDKNNRSNFVLITGHLGSWELVGKLASEANNGDFYALAKPSRSKVITEFMKGFRHKMGAKILWNDSKGILREMLSVLKNGAGLGFVMDQKPVGRKGPVVNFLGQETEFVAGPASMALKTNSPVIAVFCVRVGMRRYKLLFEEIYNGAKDSLPSDQDSIQVLTQRMASSITSAIEFYPEQWVWNYRRWKF